MTAEHRMDLFLVAGASLVIGLQTNHWALFGYVIGRLAILSWFSWRNRGALA